MSQKYDFRKLLAELRSKSLRDEKKSEAKIRKTYKSIMKDLQGFLGEEYAKLSQEGKLTYSMLQQKGEYARFLEEVTKRLDGVTPEIANEITRLVKETYELNYRGMVDSISKANDIKGLEDNLKSVKATIPTTVKATVNNPVDKITLKDTLEYNRAGITYNIRKQISIGLVNGDRYEEMAKRISSSLDSDYSKSIRIARTEAHKVREQGLCDSAVDCSNAIEKGDSGLVMAKIWRTGQDGRVRDTHAAMEGVTILTDEEFELPSGATTLTPGDSGVASEDVNCRCYCSYKLMTIEEFEKASGKTYEKRKKQEQKPLPLKQEEIETIKDYAGIYGKEINQYMYGKKKSITPYEEEIADSLHNILDKQSLPESGTYYRGQSSKIFGSKREEILQDPSKAVGNVFTNKAFMSTSSNKKSARMFYDIDEIADGEKAILFTIDAPKGAKGLDISDISNLGYEHETLFIDHTKLRIKKVEEKEDEIVFWVELLK